MEEYYQAILNTGDEEYIKLFSELLESDEKDEEQIIEKTNDFSKSRKLAYKN